MRPELRREGWIVDCVTWNPKWESPPLDADPHEFLWDETKLKNGEPPKQRLKIFNEIYHKDTGILRTLIIMVFKSPDREPC